MQRIIESASWFLLICQVLAAPVQKSISNDASMQKNNDVEQNLERDLLSTKTDDFQDNIENKVYSSNTDNVADDSSPVESIEFVPESESNENEEKGAAKDDLYEITIGDVIRDVLLTLRDHPEIVKELIASEKIKLAKELDKHNSLTNTESINEKLTESEKPLNLLSDDPKSVADNAGTTTIPDASDAYKAPIDEETKERLSNNDDHNESVDENVRDYQEFLDHVIEGGLGDPMFDYEKINKDNKHIPAPNSIDEAETEKTLKQKQETKPNHF